MPHVPARAFSVEDQAKLHRREVEIGFGPRLAAWIVSGGAQVKSTAELSLGLSRNDLNDALQGAKHFRAAWLELLPPAVELLYLAERAAHHALQLVPTSITEETFADVIATFGACLTACGQSEADGYISPDEAARDIEAIESLEARLSNLKAHRRAALAERGRMIRSVSGGGR